MPNNTLLVDVNVFSADDKSRRHILNSRSPFAGDGGQRRDFVAAATMATPKVLTLDALNSATILITSAPLQVTIQLGASVLTLAVTGTMVLPARIDGLSVQNLGTVPASCTLIQQFDMA